MIKKNKIKFSVIIPVFNEGRKVREQAEYIQRINPHVEILIVDGGSKDCSLDFKRTENVEVLFSERGRGFQCNCGASQARGDVLVFLHADTRFPHNGFDELTRILEDDDVMVGTFMLKFDHGHWLFRVYSFFTRFDSVWTRFGDQCIVVRKEFFHSLGGFPRWPLFEDVHFLRLARKRTRVHSFPLYVVTSSRKYLRAGILRQQVLNFFLMVKYLFGANLVKLYEAYYGK